jgi:signal transduction histidine kinase
MIKRGTVGINGNTGMVLENSLKRLETLIDRSLTEVRLRVEPEVHAEEAHLLQLIDQIVTTVGDEARSRNQNIEIQVDPTIMIEADQQLFHSALSNLIQNAIKYSHKGGSIQIRGKTAAENIIVEVEDECGGLPGNTAENLFKPFEQHGENREGLGLGLIIAQRAIVLSKGTIEVENLPGKGCIFRITLPRKAIANSTLLIPAA